MPSIVPPGYTRGPLVYLGEGKTQNESNQLLQKFWDHAGGFGARIAVIKIGTDANRANAEVAATLQAWETPVINSLILAKRSGKFDAEARTKIEDATGILMVTDCLRTSVALLGGTEMAQTIRRKNARGTVVGSIGPGGAMICQHAITFADMTPKRVTFVPGLGLINRLTILPESMMSQISPADITGPALLAHAVAQNPFLIAASVADNAGLCVWADGTIEAVGSGGINIVTQRQLPDEFWNLDGQPRCGSKLTALTLTQGQLFRMDTLDIHSQPDDGIPQRGTTDWSETKSAF